MCLYCQTVNKGRDSFSDVYCISECIFCLLDSYQERVNEVIGPNGGVIKGRTFQLRFPPGAVKRDTHFSITGFTPLTRKFVNYKVCSSFTLIVQTKVYIKLFVVYSSDSASI